MSVQITAYCTVCKIRRLDGLRLGAFQPQYLVQRGLRHLELLFGRLARRRDALQLVAGPPQGARDRVVVMWVIQPNTSVAAPTSHSGDQPNGPTRRR
jgi:hypothetical protein